MRTKVNIFIFSTYLMNLYSIKDIYFPLNLSNKSEFTNLFWLFPTPKPHHGIQRQPANFTWDFSRTNIFCIHVPPGLHTTVLYFHFTTCFQLFSKRFPNPIEEARTFRMNTHTFHIPLTVSAIPKIRTRLLQTTLKPHIQLQR